MEELSISGTESKTIQLLPFPSKKKKKPIDTSKNTCSKNKKRVVSETWNLPQEYLVFEKQVEMIHAIRDHEYHFFNKESKILLREIEKKMYGYKQQDLEKHFFNAELFLSLQDVIDKMITCEMKCYYCFCPMYLLYEIVRESKQWSVDRLDNDQGHNQHNYVLACLECNLKRRRRTAEKYLFTKQLTIVKTEETNVL
jgi:Zn-finger protein